MILPTWTFVRLQGNLGYICPWSSPSSFHPVSDLHGDLTALLAFPSCPSLTWLLPLFFHTGISSTKRPCLFNPFLASVSQKTWTNADPPLWTNDILGYLGFIFYYLPRVAITKYHRLDEIYCLTVMEVGNPRSKYWQGWYLLRAVRKNRFLASLPVLVVFRRSLVFLGL